MELVAFYSFGHDLFYHSGLEPIDDRSITIKTSTIGFDESQWYSNTLRSINGRAFFDSFLKEVLIGFVVIDFFVRDFDFFVNFVVGYITINDLTMRTAVTPEQDHLGIFGRDTFGLRWCGKGFVGKDND
jgi:hypothetical protein